MFIISINMNLSVLSIIPWNAITVRKNITQNATKEQKSEIVTEAFVYSFLKQSLPIWVFVSQDIKVVSDYSRSSEPSLGLEITFVTAKDERRSRTVREEESDFFSFDIN